MAGEAGFIYETKIHKALKAEDLVPAGFTPAGSDANAPDAMFLYGGFVVLPMFSGFTPVISKQSNSP